MCREKTETSCYQKEGRKEGGKEGRKKGGSQKAPEIILALFIYIH